MTGDNGPHEKPGFASRWSRLKQEAKADPEAAGVDLDATATELEEPVEDDRPDEEVLEELGLPDPDTLKPGDNFSAFMSRAVPARLRNRALRKLWISDPVLANLDELIDYGEDFTDAAAVLENIQTAYQVGRGFVDKVANLPGEESGEDSGEEAGGAEEPAEAVADESGDETPTEDGGAGEISGQDVASEPGPELEPERDGETAEAAAEQLAPAPRMPVRQRMRFRMVEE